MQKALLTLSLLPLPLAAQNLLDPLFVTASRSEQPGSAAPFSTSYLDEDFLRENTRRTLPEALQYVPGVLVQKTAHGHGSPYIRGFTGRQNLLLFDGIRMNNSTFRSGPVQYWNTIDPLSLDHLELIRSQGSVLYGSDAVGGTLNAFAKSSGFRDETEGEVFLGGSAYYEFRSNGQGAHIGRVEAATGVGGRWGLLLGISAKDFGDIKDSSVGLMKNTGHPEQDLDFRFDWAVSPESTITLAHYYVNQDDISRWHRTDKNPGWSRGGHETAPGDWRENSYDQERSLTYLRYAGSNPEAGAAIKRWSATVSWQDTRDFEFQNRLGAASPGSRPLRGSAVEVKTLGVDLTLESDLGPGTLVYGVDFYRDKVDTSGYQTNAANSNRIEVLPMADDSRYDLFGAYAQYLWNATEQLEITAGARYTRADASLGRFYDSDDVLQRGKSGDWDSVVGTLRALYRIDDAWSVYGGISQAFRAPNLDDLTGNLTALANTQTRGGDVDPEKFITYEIGTRHSTECASIGLSLFYTDMDEQIVRVQDGSVAIATNAGGGYSYGFELEGAWRFHPQWTLSGFAAWQDTRIDSPEIVGGPSIDKPSSRQLPLSGSLALRWTSLSEKFWVEGRVLAAATEDRITAADQAADNQRIPTGGTPGYIVTSLRAGWQATENLGLTLGIENLTDESYRSHGSGQNEPGLNAIAGVRLTW